MTTNFVSKIGKIKNNKEKEYYVYRINIPSNITKDLDLKQDDHIFIKAKKAEWYHMLDWSTMSKTWSKLPANIQKIIIEDGLVQVPSQKTKSKEEEATGLKTSISSGMSYNQSNIGSG